MDKTDIDLIKEIKNGDSDSFDELMQRYQDFVYSVVYSFGKTKENTMDITQNVFLKVYQNLHRFRGDSHFKTWLTRIAHNEGLNWTQKHNRHQHQETQEDGMHVTKKMTQEDEVVAAENRTLLLRCLYELNTKYRLAVVLRYFEEMPIKEIASVLKCSEGVVKNMLFRSLRKLRDTMGNQISGELR